ncbi:aldehyde dehydrogenase [Gilvibacter sp.]|uniref:aldehyde dehydrogenase n=1 Tax=Gilvibacter sp. TaxID=2729997 RepID=UPI003F4A58B9
MDRLQNFINGEYVDPIDGQWMDNYTPSTGAVSGQIPVSNQKDVAKAFEAAKAAFESWSQTPIETRSRILLKLADLIAADLDTLAHAEALDNGKPLALATKVDIPRASSNFRFFGNAITQFASEAHENLASDSINFTLRQPIGVVGCISPWNLPLYLFSWKIAPALAAGNTVVAKPSEITPVTAAMLGKYCNEAGLPPGVLNIVHGKGPEAGQAIVEHSKIKAISFTGGTATGAAIARTAAPMFKKLSLELGGKNPNLIFADCDFDKMLQVTLKSSFANQGQICLCGSRIFVQEEIYDRFKAAFIPAVEKLKVGPSLTSGIDLGAVVSKSHMEKILSYTALAASEGKLLTGGHQIKLDEAPEGYYVAPTVIEVSTTQCRLQQEEIFGPVVTIMPFKTEEEAIALANDVPYGLSSTVWTSNIDRSMRVSKALEAGIVWVNTWLNRDLRTPFGGVKASGVGREGGFEALRFFTEPKNICIQYKTNT